MSWGQRLATYVAVVVLSVSGLAAVDVLSAPPRVISSGAAGAPGSQPGRAFVLVIDSLRYQTAISPELMPYLTALRARSSFARVTPTRDAVTVPCLRAAFTGRDRTRVFGFVENFFKGNAGLESLFTQLAQTGRSAAVYSDGAFDQFGDRGIARLSNGDPVAEGGESEDRRDHVDEQNATLPVALAEYLGGKRDLVVMHVTYTDHVAHEVGISAPLYKQRYRAADALVERLDRELPAGDTLVVMGDHGHDATGRHAVGLDVPTYALYRGPRFTAGLDLGTIAIRDHRYLLGFGLGLPLPEDYSGELHVNALRAEASGLGSYAASIGRKREVSPGVPPEQYLSYALGAVILAGLFALWLQLTAAAALSDRMAKAQPKRSWLLPVGTAFLGALSVFALGLLFPRVRPFVHEPMFLTLGALWLGLWGLALFVTWRRRGLMVASVVLALPLFFAVPTVYRYGAPVALGPVWLGWVGCIALLLGLLQQWRPPLPAAGLLCALLVPFGFAESSGFRFDEWVLWPPAVLPYGFLLLSLVAKWIVLVPPRMPRSAADAPVFAFGLCAGLLLTAAQVGVLPDMLQLAAALVLLVFWATTKRELRATAGITGLLLLHHYAVRVPASAYYWQDCWLAALVLSARLGRRLPSPARTYSHAVLLLLAFVASGWVSFAWTLHRLEWRFLYDFWSAAFVEAHVAAFLPLLAGRFALPLLAARAVLRRELDDAADGSSQRALGLAWLLAGSKVASLMFWSYGIAFVSVASDVYLEAVQETSLTWALLLGLL